MSIIDLRFGSNLDYSHRLHKNPNGTIGKEYTLTAIASTPLPIMKPKLILPAEVKVCATCSYWDGERKVDTELRLVVVEEGCEGECLVQEKSCNGLNDEGETRRDCLWEHLAPDESDDLNDLDKSNESGKPVDPAP
jgi:hypothetical protein